MSEYYARGRAVFADAASFIFFLLGFVAAGGFGWPALRFAFETGAYDRGLAIYVAHLLGGGLASGLFGYLVGALSGRMWQALHQWRRARRADAASLERGPHATSVERRGHVADPTAAAPAESPMRTPAPMSCRVGPLTPSSFAAFSRRVADGAVDRRYTETASTEILTLVAWDGLEIAGVARLISDGHGALFITDFVVDPYYVRDEVEQRLIACALERVPARGHLTRV